MFEQRENISIKTCKTKNKASYLPTVKGTILGQYCAQYKGQRTAG